MMSTREKATLDEEERAEEEEGQKEGAAFVDSTCGYFAASYTTLLRIDSLLMAPMT